MKVVTCNGCFDGLHPGHLLLLGCAWGAAQIIKGRLVVGINCDDYIRRKKGREPIPDFDRAAAIMATGIVSEVVVFKEDDPRMFIEGFHPAAHVIGKEYEGKAIEAGICEIMGTRIIYVPRVGDWTSTGEGRERDE